MTILNMTRLNVTRNILAAMAFTLLPLGAAHAGSLFTPIIFAGSGNQIVCIANNVGTQTIKVTVRIIGLISGGVSSQSCSLAAGDHEGCQAFRNNDGGHCQITVTSLEQDQLRAQVRGVMFSRKTVSPFSVESAVQAQ
jgi:hypothetical protein